MSGKLISDLQKQVADLERYIEHMEQRQERPRAVVSVTLDGQTVEHSELDAEDPGQLLALLRLCFVAHGYDLDVWADTLHEELETCRLTY